MTLQPNAVRLTVLLEAVELVGPSRAEGRG